MSISSISHVEFKKWPCRPVNFRALGFRGQGPSTRPMHDEMNFRNINNALSVCTVWGPMVINTIKEIQHQVTQDPWTIDYGRSGVRVRPPQDSWLSVRLA